MAKHLTYPVPLLAPRGRSVSGGFPMKCALRIVRFCVTLGSSESSYLGDPEKDGNNCTKASTLYCTRPGPGF